MNIRTFVRRCAFPGILLIASFVFAQTKGTTVQEKLGYPATARLLVIHADDYGMSHSVNRATTEALENGWITSASILVPCPWFQEVARIATKHPDWDLGIHQALNSEWTDFRWGSVSGRDKVPSLYDAQGYLPLETPTVAKNAKIPEVETELRAQIDRAKAAGIHLTHLDTHMAALVQSPDLFKAYTKMGHEYGLPILLERTGTHGLPAGIDLPADEILVQSVVSMEPGVDATGWFDWYKKALTPLAPGVYELIVHLAYDDDEMNGATYDHPDWGAAWRQQDFNLVKSAEFRQFLKEQGFVLVRWDQLAKTLPAGYGK
jgi:chitin disaccharide deacetylase